MSGVRTITRGAELTLFLFVGVLIAGQILGQPILFAFVETGSMSPTLEPGDGFVAIPTEVTGQPQQGDIIIFQAEQIQGGGLTTHRIVGETEQGYITKGDANPFTDQDSHEPPVKNAQIAAVAWQPAGSVLVIPRLGAAVNSVQSMLGLIQGHLAALFGTRSFLGAQGIAYLVFGVSMIYYLAGEVTNRSGRERKRDESRGRESGMDPRLLMFVLTLLLISGATAAMVGPAGQQQYGVVSAEFESEQPTVIPMGESNTVPYAVGNGGFVPVYVYVEPASEGVTVEPDRLRVERGEIRNASVTLSAPPQTGYYRRFVVEHRYLALLPASTIDVLHDVHPWAPIVVIDLLVGVPFSLLGVGLLGRGRVRRKTRKKETKLGSSVRDAVRRWYS